MPKDIKRKPYSPPLVFDIGSPNLDVVGLTGKVCSAGGTPTWTRWCGAGTGGATTNCATGSNVATSCAQGVSCNTGVGAGAGKYCGTGLGATLRCATGSEGA